jgi:DNA-binding transcriptional LysR family regulator
VIDEQLAGMGLSRQVVARCAHFSLIPDMVASSLLVMTSGRLFCERFSERLSLAILPCPVEFPPLVYYQLWHARSHAGAATLAARGGSQCCTNAAKSIACIVFLFSA